MRIIKVGLAGALAIIIAQSMYTTKVFSESTLFDNDFTTEKGVLHIAQDAVNNTKRQDAGREIWEQYCIAKNTPIAAADIRSEAYASAIQGINNSISTDGERPEVLLLASRIYRGKGGASYAKNYFSKACAIYLEDVLRYPDSIEANLNAAIILYAGDVRYWDTYNDSKKKAEVYADKVLDCFKNEKIKQFKNRRDKNRQSKNREMFLEEVAALAFLVKENYVAAEKHFAKAEKLSENINKAGVDFVPQIIGNNSYGFIKIILNEKIKSDEMDANYLPYALFKRFTKQENWYWPVTKQSEANKEFLLNCLTGFYL